MLTIWGRRSSPNVQKVMWLVGELGLAYEHIPAGSSFGRLDEPGFRALNPHGRVPVLVDEGKAVWESHTIVRYLAAKYGAPAFWDPDPYVRSEAERWMDWSQSGIQGAFLTGVFWGFYRTPEDQQNWPAIKKALAQTADYLGQVERTLEGRPFIAGDQLTLADIPVGCLMYRYFELEIERPGLPNVEAWYRRLAERPAYREQVMIPFTELKGRLQM